MICAPHGAGLTNMVFSPPGAVIVESLIWASPTRTSTTLVSALGHAYWLVEAEGVGGGHPLERDLRVDPGALGDVLSQVAPS